MTRKRWIWGSWHWEEQPYYDELIFFAWVPRSQEDRMCKCWLAVCRYLRIYFYCQVCWALQIAGRFWVGIILPLRFGRCDGPPSNLPVAVALRGTFFFGTNMAGLLGGMVQHFSGKLIAGVYIFTTYISMWPGFGFISWQNAAKSPRNIPQISWICNLLEVFHLVNRLKDGRMDQQMYCKWRS